MRVLLLRISMRFSSGLAGASEAVACAVAPTLYFFGKQMTRKI
jgi:hypothetical protein